MRQVHRRKRYGCEVKPFHVIYNGLSIEGFFHCARWMGFERQMAAAREALADDAVLELTYEDHVLDDPRVADRAAVG